MALTFTIAVAALTIVAVLLLLAANALLARSGKANLAVWPTLAVGVGLTVALFLLHAALP